MRSWHEDCVDIGKKYNNGASVTVSVGGFVPKPFTPFQWFGQNTEPELFRKINLVRDAAKCIVQQCLPPSGGAPLPAGGCPGAMAARSAEAPGMIRPPVAMGRPCESRMENNSRPRKRS